MRLTPPESRGGQVSVEGDSDRQRQVRKNIAHKIGLLPGTLGDASWMRWTRKEFA